METSANRRRLLAASVLCFAVQLAPGAPARAADELEPLSALPHTPSLDPAAMDRSVDPCVDFYRFSCGSWNKNNPMPADRTRWDVYGKVTQDNQAYLWGLLLAAAKPDPARTPEQQKIGDYFAACMDEAAVESAGTKPIAADLAAIDALASTADLPALLARLHDGISVPLFGFYSGQDYGDSTKVIAQAGAGGLALPDRDYYLADDAKSKEARTRYVEHVAAMLALLGEPPGQTLADAHTAMAMETTLAAASLTRVERRQPEKVYHRMTFAELQKLTPSFRWDPYLAARKVDPRGLVNVRQPAFYGAVESLLAQKSLADWKTYLRWHLAADAAPYLSKKLVDEDFAFNRAYMRGATAQEPRWKRCVDLVDNDLGEALGKVFVEKTFTPEAKQGAETMVRQVEEAMQQHVEALDWMSPATKKEALAKLRGMRNKIGYPAHWRDYSKVSVDRGDCFGSLTSARAFENARDLAKIGKPVDLLEWGMTPPTVNAYYNSSMNDINFPAGVLQPPLYDAASDAAPNYGDTGSTVGHELTHGFDDSGSKFDATGNLRDWWTKEDRAEFEKRAACISDQYSQYVVIDDIHINGKLTLGEDLADLGGTLLAYDAWKEATAGQQLASKDGLTPDQRFFVGLAQWACGDERPESKRLNARTNPHSPLEYRVNGLVVNIPEFAKAFSCKAGQPMVKPADKVCRVW